MAVGTVLTAVVTGLVGLFFTGYGSEIIDLVSTGPPVRVLVQDQADPTTGGVIYALPGELPTHPPHVTVGPQLATVVRDHSAAQVGALTLKLILQGRRSEPVVITGVRARVAARERPLHGTLLVAPLQGEHANLDGCLYLTSARPAMLASESGQCTPSGRPYFADHYLTLASDEQLVVDLDVVLDDDEEPAAPSTDGRYYEFDLVLDAVVDGKPVQLPVRNGGEAFRLTSYAPHYSAVYQATTDNLSVLDAVDPAAYCSPTCSGGHSHP